MKGIVMQSDIALPDLSAYKDQIDGHMGRWLKDIISHMNDSDYFAKFTVVGSNDKAIYSTGSNGTKKGISWGSQFYDLIREVLNLRRKVFKQHEWSAKYVSPVILLLEFRHLLQMHSRLLDSANAPAHIAQGFLPISGALANGKIEEFKSVVMYGQGELPDSALSFTQFLGDLFFKGVDTKNSLSCKSPVVLFDWERGKAENDLLFEFEEINDHVVRFKIVSSIPYGQEIPLDDGRTLRSIQLDYKKVGVIGEQLRLKLIKSLETFFGKKRFDYLSDKYLQRFTWSVVYFVLEEEMAQRIGGINNRELEAIRFSYYPSSYRATSITGVLVTDILLPKEDASFLSSIESGVQVSQLLTRPIYELALTRMGVHAAAIERNELRQASTKAAIGSIMSRNGSHNIGSHVLSALSHNVGTMPDDRVLYQYIQHRMDYIASATTGAPDWSVPTPFVGNLMKMFYSQRHLLNHIAESDGLHAYQYQGKGTQIGVGQMDCVKIVVRKIRRYREDDIPPEMVPYGWSRVKRGSTTTLDVYEFFSDALNMSVNWGEDETVAIPGGILGQHAFYNIVENVLRNAAKHSWAGKSEKERRDAGNLEIYVDFEKVQADGTMCFTVGDNMSKVFQGKFWEGLFAKFNDSPDKFWARLSENEAKEFTGKRLPLVFARPLDGFIVPPEADSNCKHVKEFLKGKEKADSLPPQYKALYTYIKDNWEVLQNDCLFVMSLKGVCDKDSNGNWIKDQIGHRLPLPLHHRQELALSEPFINLETNRLRQSAWGLSEMKISAGYLCRAGVSVIGGLKSVPSKPPLIVPMGIPRSEDRSKGGTPNDGEFDKLRYEDLCLAYRFWVKLPKAVLIVADHEDRWKKFQGEGWEEIGITSYASVFGEGETKGDIGKMSDYGFVLVDHDGDLGKEVLKLPFRSLRIDGSDAQASVTRSDLEQTSNANAFVACVYSAWLEYLKTRRGKKNQPNLTIRLNIYDKKGAEKGLITDKDIYKVLFRECLHSVLEPITVDVSISPPQRKALLLVSLYPLDEDDDLFKGDIELFSGNHRLNIEGLLKKIAAKARYYWTSLPCSSEEDCAKWRRLTDAYRVGLERAVETMRYPKIAKELLTEVNTQPGSTVRYGDAAFLRELDAMVEGSSESGILEAAAQALDVARTTSDVFLRKYEERIVTLPPQYKGSVKSNDKPLDFSRFGVKIVFSGDADISYNRHSTDDAPLYSEPLSGSQTYLNALANLSYKDDQWAMRLAENGLLRIVIIDERVRAFVVEHGEEIRKTYESMHIAVVDTEKKPTLGQDGTSLPAFDDASWNYVVGGSNDPHFDSDFDLVVIHQGIIDKWWTDHSQDAVSEILDNLRKRKDSAEDRFVVVTTGRGRPDNIPDNAKVLAFSSIETFLFKRYPEKLNLVNSLMSILPGSPERNDDND